MGVLQAPTSLAIVVGVEFDDVGVVVDVRPSNRIPRCSGCDRKVWGTYDRRQRRWRHLDLAGIAASPAL